MVSYRLMTYALSLSPSISLQHIPHNLNPYDVFSLSLSLFFSSLEKVPKLSKNHKFSIQWMWRMFSPRLSNQIEINKRWTKLWAKAYNAFHQYIYYFRIKFVSVQTSHTVHKQWNHFFTRCTTISGVITCFSSWKHHWIRIEIVFAFRCSSRCT